jgi:predicted nucleotidyltransferase
MIAKRQAPAATRLISLSAIKRFARSIAERFQPEKIMLFGSYAYGEPNADSDVDLLVVMPARNQIDQAIKIRLALDAPFPMDLIVRTPKKLRAALEDNESFIRVITSKGKVLYEEKHGAVGAKSRGFTSRKR